MGAIAPADQGHRKADEAASAVQHQIGGPREALVLRRGRRVTGRLGDHRGEFRLQFLPAMSQLARVVDLMALWPLWAAV